MGHWNVANPQDYEHCLNSCFYGEHIYRGEMALGQSFVSCPDLQYISVYRDLAFLFSVFLFRKSKYPSGFSL